MKRVPCPYPYTIFILDNSIRNALCTMVASASLFFSPLLYSSCKHMPGTSRGAATGGLHKVPRTRKHCQRSRGGAVPDTPSPCFVHAGRPWQPSPGCIGQVSQPAIFFFFSVSSLLALLLVGGERRRKTSLGRAGMGIHCMLHAISGV
ncbi:hypothetical protein J3F84DRAFT_383508, partial [Trichoderma pleuroticola]